MSLRAKQDRVVVALAAVSCGRISGASTVRAGRGQCRAEADRYRVQVSEPGVGTGGSGGPSLSPDVVLEHWGGDAEMLTLRSPVTGPAAVPGPLERARLAARTFSYYGLDFLQVAYPDGSELRVSSGGLVLYGPRRGRLRRRDRLLRASVGELLQA
jgi:hypothetical protein